MKKIAKIAITMLIFSSLMATYQNTKAVETNTNTNVQNNTTNTTNTAQNTTNTTNTSEQNTTNTTNTSTQNTTNTATNTIANETTNGDQEQKDTTWSEPSKAQITIQKEEDTYYLKVEGLNKLEQYVYISNGAEPSPRLDESGKPIGYVYELKGEKMKINRFVESAGDIYVSIVEGLKPEGSENTEYRIVVSGKRVDKPSQQAVSNRVYCKFDDEKTIISILEPHTSTDRKVSIAIGKITDEKLLNRIKEGDKTAFNDLLTYANGAFESKDAKKISYSNEMKTYEIINKEGPSITRDIPMEHNEFYYVWVWVGDEFEGSGKYEGIEDVSLYQAKVGEKNQKELVEYREEGFSWEKENINTSQEDPDIAKIREKNANVNNKLMLQILVGIILGLIIVIVVVIIVAVKRANKRKN